MKTEELKKYVFEGKEKLKSIKEEIDRLCNYQESYNNMKYAIARNLREKDKNGIEEYKKNLESLENEYKNIENIENNKKVLYIQQNTLRKNILNAATMLLVDELGKQPLKAISKPIHYKVFQEAFDNAKFDAWRDFDYKESECLGKTYRSYDFITHIYKDSVYGYSSFYVKNDYKEKVDLSQFIERNTFLLDYEELKSYVENLSILSISDIEKLSKEYLETKAIFDEKACSLEKEREEAMDKFKELSKSA